MKKYLLIVEDKAGGKDFIDSYDLDEIATLLASSGYSYWWIYEVVGRTKRRVRATSPREDLEIAIKEISDG